MPPNTQIFFKNYERQMKIPFIIYVHIEALQVPKPRTKSTFLHKPCGFGYSVKCAFDDSLSKYEEYCGEDCVKVLWERLEIEADYIQKQLGTNAVPQALNGEEERLVGLMSNCYFCGGELGNDRWEDFHPTSGKFLGTAHKKCCDKPKVPSFVPVVMHNLAKYGAHFLLDSLDDAEVGKIFFPGNDKEGKFGFSRRLLRFIDSKLFMDEKIEDLEEILADSKKKRLKKEFGKLSEFELMKVKNFFPHCYIDSFEKFSDECLPPREAFFDRLHDEEISKISYQRVEDIWGKFKCETVEDYFRMYLKSSVFLLEDIFENFRSLCLDKYHLDPAYYFTVAGFAWDAMLRYTRVQLELLQDKKMIDFIKSNIRGGIVQCSKRHSKANNKYCKDFDTTRPPSFIVYLDANNLGGWAMSQHLPYSHFRWLERTEIETLERKIFDLREDSDYGYFLEVDLEYPKELHEPHNDLPFCSQPIGVPPPPTAPNFVAVKPILSFYRKRKYVMDYRTLQQCLAYGLELKKIHRVLQFRQCKWLEPYITYNTTLRANSSNDFETKLYKLLNNSVYGKTIEKASTDKPIYAGFSILELSKKFMYDFHYSVMVPKYKKRINLLYIDTDGVIYEIETDDFYKDIKRDPSFLELMDTSNLDRWGIPPRNKKVIGKMKDECEGKIVREFFGAGAKVYFLDVEGEEIKKAVGMKKYVKAKYISRDDYQSCVMKDLRIRRSFMETTTQGRKVQTSKTSKTVLSPGDWKRFVLPDKINTLAWGYQT